MPKPEGDWTGDASDDDEITQISTDNPAYGEATDFAPGGMVGRYQLCFELASGGMAKVYLARGTGVAGFEKVVALKRIHPHLSDQDDFVEMFMDEARLASRIDHPNVCSVFDFGRAGREHFIAMEYLLGETLARLVRRIGPEQMASPLWWAMAMRIIAEACEGLHAAHELRDDAGTPLEVVHRDVTPQNIFITYDGGVKVVDFGVARALDSVHKTRAGRVKGQYSYMAPEQAKGHSLDRRADVWSLGVLLWELLAGRRLFERPSEAVTLMAVVSGEIPPLREVRPEIPADIAVLVMRALSPTPARRPATARALARELDLCISRLGDPVGKSDLGDLMEGVFADDMARRKQMIVAARRLEAGRVLKVEDSQVTPPVSATREVRPAEHTPSSEPDTSDVRPPADPGLALLGAKPKPIPLSVDAPIEPAPTRRRAGLRFAVAGVVTLVAIGSLFAMFGTGTPATEPVDTSMSIAAPAIDTPSPTKRPAETATVQPADTVVAADTLDTAGSADADATVVPAVDVPAVDVPAVDVPAVDAVRARRRPRRPSPPVVTRPPGTVSVVTPGGWADVYLGARRVGRAPGRIELPAGHQTLLLRPFGTEAPRRVTVEVPSGGVARVSLPVSH